MWPAASWGSSGSCAGRARKRAGADAASEQPRDLGDADRMLGVGGTNVAVGSCLAVLTRGSVIQCIRGFSRRRDADEERGGPTCREQDDALAAQKASSEEEEEEQEEQEEGEEEW